MRRRRRRRRIASQTASRESITHDKLRWPLDDALVPAKPCGEKTYDPCCQFLQVTLDAGVHDTVSTDYDARLQSCCVSSLLTSLQASCKHQRGGSRAIMMKIAMVKGNNASNTEGKANPHEGVETDAASILVLAVAATPAAAVAAMTAAAAVISAVANTTRLTANAV